MNIIREFVSGKKNRFIMEDYNLDLTYITNRIIAMSYPASGIESIYRNPITEVSRFLKSKHDQHFLIINLSNRKYDYSKFDNNVKDFQWEDHHSPNLLVLFQICQIVQQFLKNDDKNVVIFHCLAGKGRTGTAICSYLIYSGRFQNANDALQYYAMKRFYVSGLGVTQPSQIRYVQYFFQLFQNQNIYPVVKKIKQISTLTVPVFNSQESCKPYVQIIKVLDKQDNDIQIYTNQEKYNDQKIFSKALHEGITFDFQNEILVSGDILIRIKNQGYFGKSQMLRFAFNTAFLDNKQLKFKIILKFQYFSYLKEIFNKYFVSQIQLDLQDIDPDSTMMDPRFSDKFQIIIKLEDICQCTNFTSFEDKCSICISLIGSYISIWLQIQQDLIQQKIMKSYQKENHDNQSILLFGDVDLDDVDLKLKEIQDKYLEFIKKNKSKSFLFSLNNESDQKSRQLSKNMDVERKSQSHDYTKSLKD